MQRRTLLFAAAPLRLAAVVMLVVSVGGPQTVRGQQASAPKPQPLLDSNGHVREDAYTPVALPDSERAYAKTLNWDTRLRRSTAVWPRRWNVNGSGKLTELVLASYKTFGVGVVGDMDPTATGEMGAIFRLTPSLQLIRSPENKHTDADIPENVPAVGLEAVGRAYAKIVDEVNKLDMQTLGASPVRSSANQK